MADLTAPVPFEIGTLATQLGGGLALFLYGMRRMTDALKTVAGSRTKTLLARLTTNRFTAAVAGVAITAVIQSSSVTTVLVVGFISAGIMTLSQSIGVIIGANIGTTITAQIIAFNIYKYGLILISIGFFTDIMARNDRFKQWGMALMGLGLILFGMELMSVATGPLRAWPPFIEAMRNMRNPYVAILLGTIFTAVVQSSSATTGIAIVLAGQGLLTLESGIGLILGANIGTCVTVIVSSIGRPREAVQAAWVHVLFNVTGVLLWMFFIPQFANAVKEISPVGIGSSDAARLAAETPRQIANAHTVFNVSNGLLFIGFTGSLARIVEWLVPKRREPAAVQPMYLDDLYLEQPALALDQVRRELSRLGALSKAMLDRVLTVVTQGSRDDIAAMGQADDDLDRLYGEIIEYLGRLSQKHLVTPQPKQLSSYISIANYIENMGDVIDNNLMDGARKRFRLGIHVSPSTILMLRPIHEQVCRAFDHAMLGLEVRDLDAAGEAAKSKSNINRLAAEATAHLAKRLVASEPNRLAAFQFETDFIEHLKRLNTLTRRIARLILELETDDGKATDEASAAADCEK